MKTNYPDFEPCGIKTVITQNDSEAPTFAWKEGDVIGIVPDDGKTFQTNFTIEEVGSDPHFATFDGGAPIRRSRWQAAEDKDCNIH